MKRCRNGVWVTALDLDSGRWPYLFVVDGEWIRDPENPLITVPDAPGEERLGETSLVAVRRGQVVLPEPTDRHRLDVGGTGSYDRANQVSLLGSLKYDNAASVQPQVQLGAGYSFGRERWLYEAGVTQPLFEETALEIGGVVYRRNATADAGRIGDTENSIFAFLFREDWRDHYEAEGGGGFVRIHPNGKVSLEVSAKSEEHRSVAKTTDWGLFNGDARMRANAPIDDGTLRSAGTAWSFDNRNDERNPTRGWLARVGYEWAGGGLGGDFRFQRGTVDLRHYLKLSPHHHFDVRLLGGLMDEASRDEATGEIAGYAAIPVQERFYLGGTGTMRASQFKSISGDRLFLANVEVRADVFRDFQIALFTDLGDSWVEEIGEFDLKTDVGVGVQDGDSNIRLNIATKLDDRPGDDDVIVSARIRRMF